MMTDIDNLIESYALKYDLDKDLIKAIVMVESSGKTFAVRFEPGYRWLYYPRELASKNNVTHETMVTIQSMSWGLMQIMGATAYEQGFPQDQLVSQLVLPHLGIDYGCKFLKSLFRRYNLESDVIAAYNAGSPKKLDSGMYNNQRYVDKVHAELVKLRRV